ncbi:MAG TPA: pilin [Limnobacter sp.]|nr:pilin [Limnobacter sp.]
MKNRSGYSGKSRSTEGFTLIELMIAIAIVGVLAAIAVPAFSNYLARARVSEAINYAQSCKTGYLEFYATTGTIPTSPDEANCPTIQTENVQSVDITEGASNLTDIAAIRVRLRNAAPLPVEIRNHVIVLQPLDTNNQPVANGDRIEAWRCALLNGSNAAPTLTVLELVPAICRGQLVTS